MEESHTPKPWIIKATIVGLCLLAFFSLAACRSIAEDNPAQAIANILRALAANAAFVGVLTGSKLGRRVAVVVLALCAVGACFGIYIGVQSLTSQPILASTILFLSVVFILWSYAFAFGAPARNYYYNLWTIKEVGANA